MEDEYAGRQKKKDPLRSFLPLIGLLMAVAMGIIAYVAGPPVHQLLYENIDQFPTDKELEYAVSAVLFVLLMLLVGIIYAIFAPKPHKRATEAEMRKQKKDRRKDEVARRERKKRIHKQMAAERKKRQEKK